MSRKAREAFGRLESELQQERSAALGRIGGTLENLILELNRIRDQLAGLPPEEQELLRTKYARLHERARTWRWYLEVQREAVGLRRHDRLDELYAVPPPLDT